MDIFNKRNDQVLQEIRERLTNNPGANTEQEPIKSKLAFYVKNSIMMKHAYREQEVFGSELNSRNFAVQSLIPMSRERY